MLRWANETDLWSNWGVTNWPVVQLRSNELTCGPIQAELTDLWSNWGGRYWLVVQSRRNLLTYGPIEAKRTDLWSNSGGTYWHVVQLRWNILACGPTSFFLVLLPSVLNFLVFFSTLLSSAFLHFFLFISFAIIYVFILHSPSYFFPPPPPLYSLLFPLFSPLPLHYLRNHILPFLSK
jgi:hypothetical protein